MLLAPRSSATIDAGETPRQILRLFAATAATLAVGMIVYYATGLDGALPFPLDRAGYVLGRDFLNTWFFGRAAYLPDPGRFYDHQTYTRWLNDAVPQDRANHLWSYPPILLLFAAPFGLLPYPVAFAAWTVLGLAALYAVVRRGGLQATAVLLSPAALFCLIGGQLSFFMAAASLAALQLLDRRPRLAGLLIALSTVKPQTGLLFPVLLVVSRRWQALLAAIVGTLGLILASCFIWGTDLWRDYLLIGLPTQFADAKASGAALAPWSPTITTAALMAGLDAAGAHIAQVAFTCLAVVLVAIGCANGPMNARRIALFLACSVFATPYLLAHDLVAVTAAVVALAAAEPVDRVGRLVVKAMFLLPMLQFAAAIAHIPGAALIPVCFAFWAVTRKAAAVRPSALPRAAAAACKPR